MKKRCFLVLLCFVMPLFLTLGNVQAEPLKIDLADDQVHITSGFTGAKVVLFGSKTRKGDVVVVLEGPERDSVVRRKERVLGAWINRSALKFEDLPSYYDYALSAEDESELLQPSFLKEHRIGLEALKAEPAKSRYSEKTIDEFQGALLRNKQARSLYPLEAGNVHFIDDMLFRVDLFMPSNVPSGEYTIRALLVDKGKVIYEQSKSLKVGLVGASSGIYRFAYDYSFLYGFACVLFALATGWLSNVIVRRN